MNSSHWRLKSKKITRIRLYDRPPQTTNHRTRRTIEKTSRCVCVNVYARIYEHSPLSLGGKTSIFLWSTTTIEDIVVSLDHIDKKSSIYEIYTW